MRDTQIRYPNETSLPINITSPPNLILSIVASALSLGVRMHLPAAPAPIIATGLTFESAIPVLRDTFEDYRTRYVEIAGSRPMPDRYRKRIACLAVMFAQ